MLLLEKEEEGAANGGSIENNHSTPADQVWTQRECVREFVRCLVEASDPRRTVLPEFDKDDDLSMRFVTAASNLRSYVFGIEPIQSYYSAKVRPSLCVLS
jgi:hypothetical protein